MFSQVSNLFVLVFNQNHCVFTGCQAFKKIQNFEPRPLVSDFIKKPGNLWKHNGFIGKWIPKPRKPVKTQYFEKIYIIKSWETCENTYLKAQYMELPTWSDRAQLVQHMIICIEHTPILNSYDKSRHHYVNPSGGRYHVYIYIYIYMYIYIYICIRLPL